MMFPQDAWFFENLNAARREYLKKSTDRSSLEFVASGICLFCPGNYCTFGEIGEEKVQVNTGATTIVLQSN